VGKELAVEPAVACELRGHQGAQIGVEQVAALRVLHQHHEAAHLPPVTGSAEGLPPLSPARMTAKRKPAGVWADGGKGDAGAAWTDSGEGNTEEPGQHQAVKQALYRSACHQ